MTVDKSPTGVPGLDEIVGGGLSEFSFNIIVVAPGSEKPIPLGPRTATQNSPNFSIRSPVLLIRYAENPVKTLACKARSLFPFTHLASGLQIDRDYL
jgi:hypothetical protein